MNDVTLAQEQDYSGYMLYHSIGQYPDKAKQMAAALAEFSEGFAQADVEHWHRVLPRRQQYIDYWCQLINAPQGSLTSSENVTSALYSLVGSLPPESLRGRKVLIAADCFPSLHFLLTGIADRYGFTLQTVPLRKNEHWVREDDFMDHWTADVGLSLITWVASTSSHRVNLTPLIDHARRFDTIVGVDITQAVGLIPFDAQSPLVDFVISTSLKWLCGTPGAGILQVSPKLLPRCKPELRGWFSQEDIFSWDLDRFDYAPDSRRFDSGTPGIVSALATIPALHWHGQQDILALHEHNQHLCEQILDGIESMDISLVSPADHRERGGSIMLQVNQRLDPGSCIEALTAAGVQADHRGHTLRFSPGAVTTRSGVVRLLDELGRMQM